jgi:hypothetical protein
VLAIQRAGEHGRARVVDQQRGIAGELRRGDDRRAILEVEAERDDARVRRRGRDVAHRGVDLGGAALEQRLDEAAAEAAIGTGHNDGASFDVHCVLLVDGAKPLLHRSRHATGARPDLQ